MASKRASRIALPGRVAALESKVAQLERELEALKPRPRAAKPVAAPVPRGPRCPGCSLPVEPGAKGTCPWCGFVFDAAGAPRRR